MKCEIFRNTSRIAGPIEFNPTDVRAIIARHGGVSHKVPNILTTAVDVDGIIVKPVRERRPVITRLQKHIGPSRTESASEVVYDYGIADKTPDELRAGLIRELSVIHEQAYTGRFEYNGVMIIADVESRLNAKDSLDKFETGQITSLQWRGRAPISETDLIGEAAVAKLDINSTAEMTALRDALIGRMAKCFNAKSTLEENISNLTDEQLATYNVRSEYNQLLTA